jgi:nitrite reductase/ring-hydroxylating ferredoxin subunit
LATYPSGWFAYGFSDELRPGRVLSRPFMGQDLVVYRTGSARACAVDPHCPHLGAHFGVGGRVEGELLVCPFHGFAYGPDGTCVRTGYGTRSPPTARVRRWPLREKNGLLLVYNGGLPSWEVSELELGGWTRPRRRSFILRDHPQETTENSVDLGHFTHVHGYRNPRMLRDAIFDGPFLSTAFAAEHPLPVLRRIHLAFEFETEIFGLGYSLVKVRLPAQNLDARLWVLPTPIDEERLTLRLAVSVRRRSRILPYGLLTRLILQGLVRDARQDFPIWENKRYLARPALADGDGPIGRYRGWARQFYPLGDGGGGDLDLELGEGEAGDLDQRAGRAPAGLPEPLSADGRAGSKLLDRRHVPRDPNDVRERHPGLR